MMEVEQQQTNMQERVDSIMCNDTIPFVSRLAIVRKDKALYEFIMRNTSFLGDPTENEYSLAGRIKLLTSGISSIPICPTCGRQLKYLKSKRRFQYHCCPRCASLDQEAQRKRETTCIARYGSKSFNNHKKQKETMLQRYGVESALCESPFREKGRQTKKRKYGTPTYNNPSLTTETCKSRYGSGRNNAKVAETMRQRYGVDTYLLSAEVNAMRNSKTIQAKIQATKRERHTFNVSQEEEECYSILVKTFGPTDVVRQYKSTLYPFLCDFYIPSRDLYIEYNGHWTHGKHPYDERKEDDRKVVQDWMCRGTKFYRLAVWVWTDYDVKKRKCALENNLNYREFWSIGEVKHFLEGETA